MTEKIPEMEDYTDQVWDLQSSIRRVEEREKEKVIRPQSLSKTKLTPEEKLRAAAAKIMYGTTDAEIALILGVSNHGRVNEAIKEVLAPLGLTSPGYKSQEDKE